MKVQTPRRALASTAAADPIAGLSIEPGLPWPLGARFDGEGINFAVFSAIAQSIDLCIYDEAGKFEVARLRLPAHSAEVWHGYLRGAKPGLIYGLRARGPWRPERGHRFNPNKLLLDPYARDIVGRFNWDEDEFDADREFPRQMDERDDAPHALKARVLADQFDWGDDRPPAIP